jgi:predicted nucleic acid-binding protein
MTPFVLDCSVTMAWVFPDEATKETATLQTNLNGSLAIVPSLWRLEVGNVLHLAIRRGRITQDDAARILLILGKLPIEIDGETHLRAWETILPLATRFSITVYAAAYLELAKRLKLPLATLDKGLIDACRAANVTLC